ncbi:sodium channel and clathrin linker 1-like isoform X2 [Gigantopelta aegis]|nr:sodium channel and clathrin linker 1-like isoform X2 [Gigantopelta aegis]XP_041347346.1 sodium channel and clathrin linker 1-like isoform X2 [Gigantopelta aegis]
MADHSAGQWIGELFQPSYNFTVDDILAGKAEDVEIKSKIKLARAFDPAAIHEVYEKVRVMTAIDDELKLQTLMREERGTCPDDADKLAGKTESDDTKAETINLEDSCIWDEEEISVLRKVFKTAKYQIRDLEVRLRETSSTNKTLAKQVSEKTTALEEANSNLAEARRANKRLSIHCDNLKEQLAQTCAKLDAVTEMWKEISEEITALRKEAQECRITADKERLAREKLQLKVEEADQEINREKHLAQENAKNRYQQEIIDLHMKLKNVSEELIKEKQSHSVTSKALGNLRQHFASLPMKDILPPNVVTEDQVKEINFLEP